MRKTFKKAIAMMMTLVMVASLGSTAAFAAGTTSITRVYGDTRYETSFGVADLMLNGNDHDESGSTTFKHYTPTWKTVVCSGTSFADALSADVYVDSGAAPILLSSGENTTAICNFWANNSRNDAYINIVGGTSVVSQDVEDQLNATCDELCKGKLRTRSIERTAGETRYETNYKAQLENNLYAYTNTADGTKFDTLIVVSGENDHYADGLSASAIREPRMLVANSGLQDYQSEYIKQIKDSNLKNIIIIGGTAAVSQTVENQLKELAGSSATVTRIAGEDRYETSAKVADYFFPNATNVVLAWGGNFADALCAGPLAQVLDAPVLLTQEYADGVTNPTVSYTSKLGDINVFAVGGAGSSSKAQLTNKAINAVKSGSITERKYVNA